MHNFFSCRRKSRALEHEHRSPADNLLKSRSKSAGTKRVKFLRNFWKSFFLPHIFLLSAIITMHRSTSICESHTIIFFHFFLAKQIHGHKQTQLYMVEYVGQGWQQSSKFIVEVSYTISEWGRTSKILHFFFRIVIIGLSWNDEYYQIWKQFPPLPLSNVSVFIFA